MGVCALNAATDSCQSFAFSVLILKVCHTACLASALSNLFISCKLSHFTPGCTKLKIFTQIKSHSKFPYALGDLRGPAGSNVPCL